MEEQEIIAIVQNEIENCIGRSGDELSQQRAKAISYYNGDMDEYIPVAEDRVATVSLDVLDTVESVMPSLMKIFTDQKNMITFGAVGPEDEDAAKQEADTVNHIFWNENEGFTILYSFVKDALLQANGIIKTVWEDDTWKREEYKGLTPDELTKLVNDPEMETEVIDYEVTEQLELLPSQPEQHMMPPQQGMPQPDANGMPPPPGMQPMPMQRPDPPLMPEPQLLVNVTIKTRKKNGKVAIYSVPPEEFGISNKATSPNPKAANFSYHQVQKTVSELIETGYDRDKVESLPMDDDGMDEEQYARHSLSDEQNTTSDSANLAMRLVWITEAYAHIDTNDDGIAELQQVTLASGSDPESNAVLLNMEEFDENPFVSATPIIRTHSWAGKSLADLIMEIQDIRTILMRSIIDNTLHSNNTRTAVNENVNLDDLLTNRPDGVVRTEGESPPSQHIMPFPSTPVPQQAFGLLELLEDVIKQRTGIGDEVQGLDTNSLSNINTGVIMAALEQSRMRIELMARIIAETGIKPLFQDIHRLVRKNSGHIIPIKLDDHWVEVNPQEWRSRTNLVVNVGIGKDSKMKALSMIDMQLQTQMQMLQTGIPVVNPDNIYSTLTEKTDLMGLDPHTAWSDPKMAPPKQPPPPDPQMMAIQQKGQADQAKHQLDQQKLQMEAQIDQQKLQLEQQKMQMDAQQKQAMLTQRMQIEQVKAQAGVEKMSIDEQNQVMNAEANQTRAVLDARLEEQSQEYKREMDMMKLTMDKYKADLDAVMKMNAKVLDQELAIELKKDVVIGGDTIDE